MRINWFKDENHLVYINGATQLAELERTLHFPGLADAANETDFHRRLAAELRPYLTPEDAVCDAGCGLGHLSLALSPYVRTVTAVEREQRALAVQERELAHRHIENVCPCCEDVVAARPAEPYGALVVC